MTFDLHFTKHTKVHRCVWDPEHLEKAASCTVAATGFRVANGITSNPQKTRFFVADTNDKSIHVLSRSNDGSLHRKGIIRLPYIPDNVEYDVASGKLTTIGLPSLYETAKRMLGDASVQVSGGMITVESIENDGPNYRIDEVLMHDGSQLSQFSSAVYFHDKIFMGSPPSDGVLMCPIPDAPLKRHYVALSE